MPRMDSMSSIVPAGHSSCAARSSAALNEPLRRLPAIPTIRMVLLQRAFGGHCLGDQCREAQRAGPCILAVGEDEVKLAEALAAALAQRQCLERPGLQLTADAVLGVPAVAEAHRRSEDGGRHVT